ncbi:hypothetical protein ACS96_31115 [Pseudomonas aeruginosa]|nr:hypothetical protein ACS96_31115 [Pseudomonas aeruginosa]
MIEYAGRIDHQVKLRGLRIELGEIEARLLEHPWVREAAVLAVDGRQLVGYVVLESEGGDWREALAAHLAASLPEYMVPAQWLALERMPLSPNGKLDRKALPAPEVSVAQAGYSAPRNAVERTLAEIWQDLLGVERVGLDDNFFSLGGDSIVSIQVVSRARQAGLQLSPRDLFQHQNIRSLALAAKAGAATAEQGPASGEVALAPVQRWFFEQSIPNRQHWNQSLLLQARQPLDGDRLGRALERLQAQHDALRLRFREERGAWHQAYAEQAGEPLWRRQAGSEEALLALCEEAQRSLDLEQGPLLRALLVDMADGSQRLLLVIHHLAVDGVSWRILLEDLQLHPRWQPGAGTGGRARRAVPGRPGPGPWLPPASGADCRAFRRQPVRGWGTDVPHRRPGALPRDGVIEYAGRIDHQVKLRGLRIELGEIEARLLEHPWVREAAVLAVDGRQLVGYVVLESEGGDWREALAAHLAASLPEYMVPAQWLALERMPLSPNGKLDRKALPAPEVSVAQAGYSAPRNAVERTLAEIWQDLLGVERVGLDDNFFSLGGDSIVSIQVVSRARQAGLQLSPRDLFQHQNIRSLALAAKAGAATAEQGPASGEVALAPVQRWFFEQSIPNRQHWNQSLLLQARQPLDGDRLGRALERLQAQHDALRLRFREERGAWHQAYAEQAGEPLWRRQAGSEEALLALCEEAQRSLDLEQGPLLRALLVDMADGSQRLLLVIHHLAVDGVSWRILLEDLHVRG